MQKDQSDLGLIFRKRARRRLVGAIALVLLMVILLPRVLEDRAQTNTQQDIAIVMPDGSGASDVVVSEELITLEDLKAEAAANTKKSTLPKAESVKTKAVVEDKPKIKAATEKKKVVAKEVVKNVAVKKTEFTSKNNPFYVQIGVFSDVANVKKLQVKLDELGYQSVAEKMKTATGEKTRLRTSAFEAESEAEIALKNIKDAGLTGMVVSQK
ncbi:MAG: SPOR domain-containing protein [Methylophilaceae bacterium]|jgi:DedD protein|nr:SPOR domain-containing protein [Methylophilaceae bacterium]